MEKNNFKVFYSKKINIVTAITALVIEILIIGGVISEYNLLAVILFEVIFIPIVLILILSDLLFKVDVSDEVIKVRTNSGRKYKIDIWDINFVECHRNYSRFKGGTSMHFYIIVATKTEKLQMEGTMIGFDKMAGYLLDKLQAVEIDKKAASSKCKKTLAWYKTNEYKKIITKQDQKNINIDTIE